MTGTTAPLDDVRVLDVATFVAALFPLPALLIIHILVVYLY